MAVPYTFGSATASIPLSQLDSNFATTITMGNTAVQLGNTVTTLNNMTLGNVTVSSGNVVAGIASGTITQAMLGTNVAGNGPAFSAYQSSSQTLTSATFTKLLFQTEEWDTNNNFASSTFTPTVAGYYLITGAMEVASVVTQIILRLYKNGALWKNFSNTNTSVVTALSGSAMVYCNGTTDYVELYGYAGTGQALEAQKQTTYFQAVMVRSA